MMHIKFHSLLSWFDSLSCICKKPKQDKVQNQQNFFIQEHSAGLVQAGTSMTKTIIHVRNNKDKHKNITTAAVQVLCLLETNYHQGTYSHAIHFSIIDSLVLHTCHQVAPYLPQMLISQLGHPLLSNVGMAHSGGIQTAGQRYGSQMIGFFISVISKMNDFI